MTKIKLPENMTIVTTKERPDLISRADSTINVVWQEFMLHGVVANKYWDRLYETFPEYQYILIDKEDDRIIGVGNCLPLNWNGTLDELPDNGWEWALQKGFDDYAKELQPNIMSALSISIDPEFQGQGLSDVMVRAMKQIGETNSLSSLIVPVRPNLKSLYPITPMESYIKWQNADGLPFDAWIRVHIRLGAQIIKVCPNALQIIGSIGEWEKWTKMRFPASGDYTVPGALCPITIDIEEDRGEYVEPNVWLIHKII